MQQRVGLARAFATEAPILLMDEPFSALDPLIRTKLQDELLQLQRTLKKTIIFVSHDLEEALKIGNRITIMEGGRIVQIGRAGGYRAAARQRVCAGIHRQCESTFGAHRVECDGDSPRSRKDGGRLAVARQAARPRASSSIARAKGCRCRMQQEEGHLGFRAANSRNRFRKVCFRSIGRGPARRSRPSCWRCTAPIWRPLRFSMKTKQFLGRSACARCCRPCLRTFRLTTLHLRPAAEWPRWLAIGLADVGESFPPAE